MPAKYADGYRPRLTSEKARNFHDGAGVLRAVDRRR
jgi:hypothetical protein